MAVKHELKTWPDYWHAIERGEKTFEVRRDDRGFQKGDTLVLIRMKKRHGVWVEDRDNYLASRYELCRKVTYVLTGGQLGIEPGYVVMGLKK